MNLQLVMPGRRAERRVECLLRQQITHILGLNSVRFPGHSQLASEGNI